MSRLSVLPVVLLSVALQACSMLGGEDDPPQRHYASQGANADCQRLAPYVVNADGTLSRADLTAGLQAEFKKWDKNGDGQLSQSESVPLNDYLRSLHVNASPVMDWNGDGHISFDEFASGWRTMFDLCLREGSEVVTKADLERSPNVTPPRKDDTKKSDDDVTTSPPHGGGGGQ